MGVQHSHVLITVAHVPACTPPPPQKKPSLIGVYNFHDMFCNFYFIFVFLVTYRTAKLTDSEINRMSTMVGVDWDGLAGLMNIPYCEREEIRMNHSKYPDSFSKAEKILSILSVREDFCRVALKKCVEELNLDDVMHAMHNVQVLSLFTSFDD